MNTAPVIQLHEKVGPWELAHVQDAINAMREIAASLEAFAELAALNPEAVDRTAEHLRGALRELGKACTDMSVVSEPRGSVPRAPSIFLSERLAQGGHALSLYVIECFDAKPAEAILIYQCPTPGEPAFRVTELFQGDRALGRAYESYRHCEKRLLVATVG